MKIQFFFKQQKMNVPVFCPAITDGALGFHLYLFQQKHKDFVIDPVSRLWKYFIKHLNG
jgi:deoxyhypusine synthase